MLNLKSLISYSLLSALLIGALGAWSRSVTANDNAIHTIADCVYAQWAEYEDRTGTMPTQEITSEWNDECEGYFNASM